jgi:nitroreductase
MLKLLARDGILRRIVEAASAAPSVHNTQPWKFVAASDDRLEVQADPDRALWVADPHARAAASTACPAAELTLGRRS